MQSESEVDDGAPDIWLLYLDAVIKQLCPALANSHRWPLYCYWNYMLQNLFSIFFNGKSSHVKKLGVYSALSRENEMTVCVRGGGGSPGVQILKCADESSKHSKGNMKW